MHLHSTEPEPFQLHLTQAGRLEATPSHLQSFEPQPPGPTQFLPPQASSEHLPAFMEEAHNALVAFSTVWGPCPKLPEKACRVVPGSMVFQEAFLWEVRMWLAICTR